MDFYKKARGIGKGTYLTKAAGYPLCAATLLTFRFQIGELTWFNIACALFFVLYPHLSFAFFIRSGCDSSVEIKALAFDGFLVGIFAAQMHFALLPTACFFIVPAATALAVNGPKLFCANATLSVVGAILTGLLIGFHYTPSPSLEVQLLSITFLLFGIVAHNYVDYQRSLKFIAAKEQIKQQKQQIEKNLREKELLLKEIHHRVKNNLQIITSLLNLQAEHVHDESALNAIRSSKGRVKSMSTVHEILYQNDDLKEIDISEYIPRLAKHVKQLYKDTIGTIELQCDIAPVKIDLQTAIPLGLVINEVISNSCKHAFKNRNSGIIRIEAGRQSGTLKLLISDNGIGILKKKRDQNGKRGSLGMQLVSDMIKQLKAKATLQNEDGTVHRFDIPIGES